MKRFLVNADDFGLCRSVTDGIVEAHREGIVTSTSLMASGESFDHAVHEARRHPELRVGVHLTLVEERPLTAGGSLCQPNGKLPPTYAALVSGLMTGRIRLSDVRSEWHAQISKCVDTGLPLTHLDSHQHVHAWPALFDLTLELGRKFGIRGLRIPRDTPWRGGAFGYGQFVQKSALCGLARYDARTVPPATRVCDRMAGLFESGALTEDRLLRILKQLPEGASELVCHPGQADAEDTARYAHWNYHWAGELRALTSARVREQLQTSGIALIHYGSL